MTRYYFTVPEAGRLIAKGESRDLSDLPSVQWEAAMALVDLSRDPTSLALKFRPELSIEVRDDAGPVMQVTFKLEPRQEDKFAGLNPPVLS